MAATFESWTQPLRLLALGGALALASACGPGEEPDDGTPTPTAAGTPTEAPTPTAEPTPSPTPTIAPIEGCDVVLAPSADDQEAVQSALIDAQTGETVCLTAGTFSFYNELSLSVDEVTFKGAGREETILDFTDQISGGNGISVTADNTVIQDLTVLNTPGDGIRSTDVVGASYINVAVIWEDDAAETNGAYGLYPVGSDRVLIQDCYVKGASDAGVYVGQSTNILVIDNEAVGNVAGIEIENSTDAEVTGNWAHGNTGGVLVFNLPDLPVMDGKRAKVHSNTIEANNTRNFAPEGNIVGIVPQGTGILILATDSNEFHNNVVKDNQSVGMAILSYSEVLIGTFDDPDFDPYPEANFVHDNTFENNGYDPKDVAIVVMAGVNAAIVNQEGPGARTTVTPPIIWDGCVKPAVEGETAAAAEARYNCYMGNTDDSDAEYFFADMALCGVDEQGEPAPFVNYSTDISPWVCEYDALPSISLSGE